MTEHPLYRGLWPQNVSKLAKYGVRMVNGEWKVTVHYDLGEGLMYLAAESSETDIVDRVNQIKQACGGQSGGVFYINEYHHLIVPVAHDGTSRYFYGGRVNPDFTFEFEGALLTTRPVGRDGQPLAPGDPWIGPRPGIPYKLAAGGKDIYFETPALTESDPPTVRPGVTRKVKLSTVLRDRALVARTVLPIQEVRGHQGGRFYVNEHGAAFTPVDRGDGNGLNYIYCGQIYSAAWFPEPPVL
jgi:hypothetical protein